MSRKACIGIVVAVSFGGGLALLGRGGEADANRGGHRPTLRYEVTLTNLTRGQIFSPALLVAHGSGQEPLFRLGEPASEELAAVAEDAVLEPLIEQLEMSDDVASVVVLTGVNGPILPGESATAVIETTLRALRLSAVGMLVTTNDAFYALNGGDLPFRGSRSDFLRAYDAGSEANNELCSHIPGPPCGNAGVRDTEGAEGFVHVHAGVHGVGDLEPAEHDWRNPVALLTVKSVARGRGS